MRFQKEVPLPVKKAFVLFLCLVLAALPASAAEADDARGLILEAMEVYAWFTISPLDVNEEAPATEDGRYPVFDELLARPETLQACLDRYFSTEISCELWSWGTYEPVNGWLYACPPENNPLVRPVDPDISDVTAELTEETDGRRVYTATVCRLFTSEPETYEFVSEYQDGSWVFTEFPFFW